MGDSCEVVCSFVCSTVMKQTHRPSIAQASEDDVKSSGSHEMYTSALLTLRSAQGKTHLISSDNEGLGEEMKEKACGSPLIDRAIFLGEEGS